jgi:hypothetical protein
MTQDIGRRLKWFLYNLDLQLDDIALENKNKETELYFDTADLRAAILGLHDFYRPDSDEFNRNKFNKPERLVHCLAVSNWLGSIHLLPPHQKEFLTLLKIEFGVTIERDPVGVAKRFLHHAGFADAHERISPISELSQAEIKKLVTRQAGSAHDFFKAVQCIVPWHKRLPTMLHNGTLHINPQKVDYENVISNSAFQQLLDAFNLERPSKQVQNLADVIAIVLLNNKILLYRKGESNVIPRLFVSAPIFRKIIGQKEFAGFLTYSKTPEGRDISVFRDEDYFVFRATFRSDLRTTSNDGEARQDVETRLRALREEVATILKARSDIEIGNVSEEESGELFNQALVNDEEEIRVLGKPLSHAIEELRRFSFLENVWLRSRAPEDLDSAVRQLIQSAQEVKIKRTKTFKSGLDKALGDVKQTLEKNVQEVEWVMTLWDGLEQRAGALLDDVPRSRSKTLDYFRDLALLRYSFPSKTHERIEIVLKELLEKGSAEKYARRFVITACLRGARDPRGEAENLIVAVAALRVAKMDRQVIELLEKMDHKQLHFSLKIVYAESMFSVLQQPQLTQPKSDPQKLRHRISTLMSELESASRKTRRDQSRADILIGLAYLNFRLWRYRGGEALWRKSPKSNIDVNRSLQKIIDTAIAYAKRAYADLKDKDEKVKKVYALNIYVYYLVEGGTKDREEEIIEAVRELGSFKDQSEVWMYRFDDTLARHYFRRAVSKEVEAAWQQSLETAKRLIHEAKQEGIKDRDVEGCMIMIDNAFDAGYQGRHRFFM